MIAVQTKAAETGSALLHQQMKPDFDRKMLSQIALTFLIVLLLSVPVQHLLHLSFFLSIFSIYYTFLGIK